MKPRPYAERWRDRANTHGHWFVKANAALEAGFTRLDTGAEDGRVWKDPETGELVTLNIAASRAAERRQRERDAQR